MRLPLRFLFAAALVASASVSAQDEISAVQVRGVSPALQLQAHQAQSMAGVYRLDNGGVFRLKAAHRHLTAQLGDRSATELIQTGDNRFVSLDQRMTVEYQPEPFGDLIILSYPLDLARADSPMVQVRVAAN